ncbi:MAG: ArsR family transcriptional regulator [Theionarchaea archaeon]|nr:ArsR family transcriptional regulator [Theionarchaea archaeon]
MRPVNMCDSRFEILKILKKECSTVDTLSSKIGISPTAVRQHLAILERESLVTGETLKEGIGRPKVIYSITEEAEKLFPKHYGWLMGQVISLLLEQLGEEHVHSMFNHIGTRFAEPYLEKVEGKSLEERAAEVTKILNEWGAYAALEDDDHSITLKNYNCAFYQVAQVHPQVCNVHTTFLEKLLEKKPEQTASMAEGNDYCAYRITVEQ